MNRLNYEKVFKTLVEETGNYLVNHSLRAMVLGVSGGIDSTVVAAICCEVNKQTNIPLIGRSLPIKNKKDEFDVSTLVGIKEPIYDVTPYMRSRFRNTGVVG